MRLEADKLLAEGSHFFSQGKYLTRLIAEIKNGNAYALAFASAAEENGLASTTAEAASSSSEDEKYVHSHIPQKFGKEVEEKSDQPSDVQSISSEDTFTQESFASLLASLSPRSMRLNTKKTKQYACSACGKRFGDGVDYRYHRAVTCWNLSE